MSPEEVAARLTSVTLSYSYEQDLVSEQPAVQQWWVRAVARDWEHDDEQGNPAEETVARLHIVKGSLLDASLRDQLDALEADLDAVASALLDPDEGDLKDEVHEHIDGTGNSLLILNSVELSGVWRGHGIGVMLAGLAMQAMGDDVACMATFPAPLDGSEGEARKRAIRKLEKVWAQLGFEPFAGGVWILDPTYVTLANAVDSMKARFGLG